MPYVLGDCLYGGRGGPTHRKDFLALMANLVWPFPPQGTVCVRDVVIFQTKGYRGSVQMTDFWKRFSQRKLE